MPPLISLVPNSGIHFWDVDLDADALPRQARTFWEEPLGGPADVRLLGDGDEVAQLAGLHTGSVRGWPRVIPVRYRAAPDRCWRA